MESSFKWAKLKPVVVASREPAAELEFQVGEEPRKKVGVVPPKWTQSLVTTLAAIEKTGSRVIGIASDRSDADVATIVEGLLDTYRNFGRRANRVDADELVASMQSTGPEGDIDVLRQKFEATYRQAIINHDLVLVNLPPAVAANGQPAPGFMAGGSACDVIFLVCLTSAMTRFEVKRVVDYCRLGNVKLGGLLLNDRKLPLSSLLG